MKHHSQISFDYKCIVINYIIYMFGFPKTFYHNKLNIKLLK